jgi:hypothetical protein
VYTINIENEEQLDVLQAIESQSDSYSFWDYPAAVGTTVYLQVAPHKLSDFGELIEKFEIKSKLYIANLQEKIDNEQPKQLTQPKAGGLSFTQYNTLAQIYAWLDTLPAAYPGTVTKIIGGSTFEGRRIEGVKISYKAGNNGIFIEAGIHAREWISPATTTWILNELLTSSSPAIRNIAENYDWYIFPVTNPDGYVHTHVSTRMWRKTRTTHSLLCTGTDPNRNWGFGWGQGGSSTNACSETFRGPTAFSDIETRSLSQFYASLPNIGIYLSMHSFSQVLLVPYGNTQALLDNFHNARDIGIRSTNALTARFGTQYQVGTIAALMGIASGGSIDWIKGDQRTNLSYCFELRDRGQNGFILPADQIIPSGQETTDGIVEMIAAAREYGYI